MKRTLLLTLLLLSLAAGGMRAQTGKHFDADKQMSSSFTTQVYQDRDGFMWVATRNGLNRYDGYQFQILKKEQKENLGMASNYVNCLLQNRHGLFYIGMYGALQTYDGERFTDITTRDLEGRVVPCYITCLLERTNGEILIGTSGHGMLQITDKTSAQEMGGALEGLFGVHRILEDRWGRLWIVTESQGLWLYDESADRVQRFLDKEDERSTLTDICEDSEGRIYVATTGRGLLQMEGSHIVPIAGTEGKAISTLCASRSGTVLIGYDGEGVAIYDPHTGQLTDNPYYSRELNLSTTKVYSIAEDRSGNIWLGLLQKGIFMQPGGRDTGFGYMGSKLGERNVIGQACVTSVLRSTGGLLWVGTDKDGLYCLSADMRLVKHFKEDFPTTILSLCEDSEGRIWAGSYKEGVGVIDPTQMTFRPYRLPQGTTVSVFGLQADRDGHLWMGTMGDGLLRIDLAKADGGATDAVKAYVTLQEPDDTYLQNSIINNYISQISLSPDGRRIYVATSVGVSAMDIATENWREAFGGVNCLNYGMAVRTAREFGGKLYVGTNDGLYTYDLAGRAQEVITYTKESRLAENGISSIEQDHQGRLWIATDHGLCCLNPSTGYIENYFVDDGLQSNEFSDGASFRSPDGEMLFGGLGGITWFNPEHIRQSQWNAEVQLTAFFVNGESVTSSTRSGLWHVTDTTIMASRRFNLSSSAKAFALKLSTFTYENPEHIVYLFRINNDRWVRMQPGDNTIALSRMPAGVYHFRIVAEHNSIRTPERTFTIVIHAPWYRTPLAFLLYFLAAAAAAWVYLRYVRRKQQHLHAEEMADARMRFFMDISHEIRTPLTLIISPLLSLIKQDQDPYRRSVYETIRRNSERILGLINQLMDIRKIEKQQMQMHMQQTDLIGFVDDLYTLFEQQARNKNIQFAFKHDDDQLPVWIDRGNFDKVIVNILSNAFKYTPAGGDITINVSHDQQHATIAVADSGVGIPEDQLEKIFERFYQASSSGTQTGTGTGIGLHLTRSLVELHHGTIIAHNLQPKGCEFVVTIPLGKEHLKPEEIMEDTAEMGQQAEAVSLTDWGERDNGSQPEEAPTAAEVIPRILIAEDDPEIRDYLAAQLGNDYTIVTRSNGREAFSEALHQLPDLIISDVMMPEMDGYTLCANLKRNPQTFHVPVILLTAKSSDEDQLAGLETGAEAYFTKPFNMDILRRTIINLIHTHRQLRLKYERVDALEQQLDDVKLTSPDDKLLKRIMDVINQNIQNSELSIDNIASEVGISRVHLHRKMKALTGQTPHEFIRSIRLKQAAHLLSQPGMNITEVVYACGFTSAASFATIFKKYYGMAPREYMLQINNNSKTTNQS